jgi:hypothetical protein
MPTDFIKNYVWLNALYPKRCSLEDAIFPIPS